MGAGLVTTAGAIAGAVSTLVFVVVHDITISDIWDMAPVMVVAGSVCGALLAWAYQSMVARDSLIRWAGYTGLIVGLMALIPLASIIVFDPIVPFEDVVSLDGPPSDLIRRAMPFTVVVTALIAVVITVTFGVLRQDLLPTAVAITVLMLFLGLNLTIVGLVEFTSSEVPLLMGFIGLVAMLGVVYGAVAPVVSRLLDRI